MDSTNTRVISFFSFKSLFSDFFEHLLIDPGFHFCNVGNLQFRSFFGLKSWVHSQRNTYSTYEHFIIWLQNTVHLRCYALLLFIIILVKWFNIENLIQKGSHYIAGFIDNNNKTYIVSHKNFLWLISHN